MLSEKAVQIYNQGKGFNCSQSVYLACRDESLMPERTAILSSGAFGGGVGGLGQTCGALCGALMALYERHAPKDMSDLDKKRCVRALMQDFGTWFERRFGSCMCDVLRPQVWADTRSDGHSPCTVYVEACARRLDEMCMPKLCRIEYASTEYDRELSLRQKVLREPLGMNLYEEDLSHEADAAHFGAFLGGELTGTMFLQPIAGGSMQIRQVAVANEHRRKGIGRLLMRYAEIYAGEQHITRLFAHVRRTAEVFYESIGYTAVGNAFAEVGIPHILMEKTL